MKLIRRERYHAGAGGLAWNGIRLHVAIAAAGSDAPGVVDAAWLVVDTGSDVTAINESVLARVLAPRIDRPLRNLRDLSQRVGMYHRHHVVLGLSMFDPDGNAVVCRRDLHVVAMPTPEDPDEFGGVLGRDFLMWFRLGYDGPLGAWAIETDVADGD